ncbi:hypothetical protein LEP1GSC193_1143 [Leptospira alstonii serovar Pingchang str. 80-412]|uniref:Uncharacterized protein n=2 Tax=Leptospira alstonii TaxID=28452 RepID=M6CVD7_9LEPT|nr:hypothetical protein LEP1GSC194_2827 [Leptospira alstonii serovar Sichuan str. 79601]EQA82624.1 hypothetical protein LEP1GSC193_1143 [Leptospira alstonii serovar Pingchang str. 80-412]
MFYPLSKVGIFLFSKCSFSMRAKAFCKKLLDQAKEECCFFVDSKRQLESFHQTVLRM